MLKGAIDALTKSGEICGKVTGGVYIPEAFSQVQERSIRGFFEHNHYVESAMLTRFSIQRSDEFMARLFPDAQRLENCFVSEHLVGQLREEIT